MDILIHCLPTVTNIHDLSHSDVKRNGFLQLLHAILAKLWVPILIVRLDKTIDLVQIYIVFLLEAQMV
jgi:hypothetical protein